MAQVTVKIQAAIVYLCCIFVNVNCDVYSIVLDVGSSRTSMFIYRLDSSVDPSKVVMERHQSVVGSLHTLDTSSAYNYIKPLLYDSLSYIPSEYWKNTDIYIYSTSGMRFLSMKLQDELYNSIYKNYQDDLSMTYQLNRSNIQTISKEHEGFFDVVAINYLLHNVGVELIPITEEIFGTIDFGGSNMLIVFDQLERSRIRLSRRRPVATKSLDMKDFYIRSFIGYGGDTALEKTMQFLFDKQEDVANIENPCLFNGYSVLWQNGKKMNGTGKSKSCLQTIANVIDEGNSRCNKKGKCSLMNVGKPDLRGNFHAINGFYNAIDFARTAMEKHSSETHHKTILDDLRKPNPTIRTLSMAAEMVCAIPYQELIKTNITGMFNTMTSLEKLPNRCFELNYAIVLLSTFGFLDDDQRVFYTLEIDGTNVHWGLGAYLVGYADKKIKEAIQIATKELELFENGKPVGWNIMLLLLTLSLILMFRHSRRIALTKSTMSIIFVNDVKY